MKNAFFLLLLATSALSAETVIVNPPAQYYYYSEYQPFNGPMRGPNSLDYYKYGGHHFDSRVRPDYRYYDRNLPPYY